VTRFPPASGKTRPRMRLDSWRRSAGGIAIAPDKRHHSAGQHCDEHDRSDETSPGDQSRSRACAGLLRSSSLRPHRSVALPGDLRSRRATSVGQFVNLMDSLGILAPERVRSAIRRADTNPDLLVRFGIRAYRDKIFHRAVPITRETDHIQRAACPEPISIPTLACHMVSSKLAQFSPQGHTILT
jgi:hypothetical protein